VILLALEEVGLLEEIASQFGWAGYQLGALLAVLFVTLACGLVGTLVVGNRMSFFSDAMSHCAFAGVALGVLITFLIGGPKQQSEFQWMIPLIMVTFGAAVGLSIEFVREKTGLASDTVIGVFFAGAIGFGTMLLTALGKRSSFNPEMFLFGSPLFVQPIDLLYLMILVVLTILVLIWRYNQFVLGSFNPSLARSRRATIRLNNYCFILLLALIVNFSIVAVGVLLINAMLIVPAATASNLARNLRQLFWYTIVISVGCGLVGLQLSRRVSLQVAGEKVEFGPSGTIIVLTVISFFASMFFAAFRKRLERLQPTTIRGG
jgi:zinc transport system permease protein